MALLNTAMNALGTAAALTSLFGNKPSGGAAGKLNKFMSEIRDAGVARTNLFDVTITPPIVALKNKDVAEKISLYAEGAVIPGRTISTSEVTRFGYGPTEKVPYSMQYNDVTLQIIGDGKGDVYKFFYNWMQGIVRGDYDLSADKADLSNKSAYEVEFKSNYATTISIAQYNEQGDPVLVSTLIDAFPISMPDVNLSWTDGSLMQFSVTFAFFQARLDTAESNLAVSQSGVGELSTLQKLVKVGTAIQAISALRSPTSVQGALAAVSTIKTIGSVF